MMMTWSSKLAYLAALVVVIATGLVHGLWSQRWANDDDLQRAAQALEGLPLTIGDWQGEKLEVERAQLERAEVAAYLFRRYTNRLTGQTANVILLCGRFGPLSVHTPDVCFGGAGYQTLEPPERLVVRAGADGIVADTWMARFEKKNGPVSQYLRALWSWSTGETWRAPDYPRLVFRGAPVLYKMYVVHEMVRPDEPLDADAAIALLKQLLPALREVLG